ncbi:hemin receptor [Enterovibrio norvegicus FF-162]|uniref:heme/hemin ABC transporter substrate-binding protein n=1 Tax=Enterovibrio norvegicus TaxID=188144 RepID=UPI00031A1D16|nr:ABC transporter substrate-binding protein [Enterovibrio norvegicus]OEE75304.1 hemin receptor [Enterovibrio norvegicus FF-162]
MKTNTSIKALSLTLCMLISPLSMAADKETRIISAGSTVTELLFALGADNKVVAVDLTSRHYLDQRDIPVLGYHRQLAAEGLLALSPTHLLGSPDMGPDSTLQLLKQAGVTVEALPTGNSIDAFHDRVDTIAQITDTQQQGELIKKQVEERIGALNAQQPVNAPSVLFMMLSDGRPVTVAGDQTTVNTVIQLAGGNNPAAKESTSYKPLSAEAIVTMQPDYILVSDRTLEHVGGMDGMLKQQPLLAATPAFQNNKVIPIRGHSILGGFGLASLELATSLNTRFNNDN